jgi:hypothetical protein
MCSKNNYLRAIRTRKPQVFLSDSSRTRHISHNNTKRKIQSSAHRSKDSERTLAGKETEGLSGARAGDLAGGGTTADTERAGNRAGNKSRAELESRQQIPSGAGVAATKALVRTETENETQSRRTASRALEWRQDQTQKPDLGLSEDSQIHRRAQRNHARQKNPGPWWRQNPEATVPKENQDRHGTKI